MDSIQISIIIAIYNAEKYLVRCLESIKKQTFSNYEVILIDDGSIDKSYDICCEYANKDARFIAYHKQNEGVGATRQLGITLAKGKYSIHIDPDDWIDPDMIQTMYQTAEKQSAEITICDIIEEYRDHSVYKKQRTTDPHNHFSTKDIISGNLWGGMVNKLILCDLYKRNNISFTPDIFREDVRFLMQLLPLTKNFAYVPKGFYHYDKETNINCLTKNKSKKRLESDFHHYSWLIDNHYISQETHLWIYKELADYSYIAFANNYYSKEEYFILFKPKERLLLQFLNLRKRIFVFLNLNHCWLLSKLIYFPITLLH